MNRHTRARTGCGKTRIMAEAAGVEPFPAENANLLVARDLSS